jgi:hypothetical protein
MKKTALFLGLAAMMFATPVFAAAKPMGHMAAKPAAMCMVHGKKVHCKHQVMHKKMTHKAAKKTY